MKIPSLCVVLLLSLAVSAYAAADKLKGVKPNMHNLYQGEHIECDGGKKVPISQVNDDFCDCLDGSDEPGTSACPRGKFYCKNEGFRGNSIPSGWVDDGRCDCCDGSDESTKACPNTCNEASKEHLAKVAGEISIQERGLALREAYVTTAQSERNRRQQLITEAEGKLEKLIERADELEKIKIVAEEEHSAVHDKVDQRLKAAQEAKTGENAEGEAEEHKDTYNVDEDPEVKPVKEETPRVHNYLDYESNHYEEDAYDEETTTWEVLVNGFSDFCDGIQMWWHGISHWVTSVGTPETAKDKAVQAWTDAKNERDSVQREIDDHRKFVNLDFGADGAYHALYGNTYDFSDKEYTYKLDSFSEVRQTKPGHSSNLGRYKGWDEHKPNVMIFDGGDRCWGAPDRSTKVTFICGDEHKVIDVKEPNKCEYTMLVKTPAACSKAALEALKNGE